MSKYTDPAKKKEEFYKHEHRIDTDHKRFFVISWRKKKARLQKNERRENRQELHIKKDSVDNEDLNLSKKKMIRKYNVYKAKELIELKREKKARQAGTRFFNEKYNSKKHREKYKNYLDSLLRSKTPIAIETIKEILRDINVSRNEKALGYFGRVKIEWYEGFLSDEPTYKEKIEDWLKNVQSNEN